MTKGLTTTATATAIKLKLKTIRTLVLCGIFFLLVFYQGKTLVQLTNNNSNNDNTTIVEIPGAPVFDTDRKNNNGGRLSSSSLPIISNNKKDDDDDDAKELKALASSRVIKVVDDHNNIINKTKTKTNYSTNSKQLMKAVINKSPAKTKTKAKLKTKIIKMKMKRPSSTSTSTSTSSLILPPGSPFSKYKKKPPIQSMKHEDEYQQQQHQEGPPIRIILPIKEINWMKERITKFNDWNNSSLLDEKTIKKLGLRKDWNHYKQNADIDINITYTNTNNTKTNTDTGGPWLDYLIIGSPKCGTTLIQSKLATSSGITPMIVGDYCISITDILQLAYNVWPKTSLNNKTLNNKTNNNDDVQVRIEKKHNEKEKKNTTTAAAAAVAVGTTNVTTNVVDNNNNTGSNDDHTQLLFRGSKCPQYLGSSQIHTISKILTKTKFIVGIRHPVLWFQSFWRMQGREDPYERMGICPCIPVPHHSSVKRYCEHPYPNETDEDETVNDVQNNTNTNTRRRTSSIRQRQKTTKRKKVMVTCRNECGSKILCSKRGRFHLGLAQLGKTALDTTEELNWLAPNDPDGGSNLLEWFTKNTKNNNHDGERIKNKVFFYEHSQLTNDPNFWNNGLSSFLGVSHIPNTQNSNSNRNKNNTQEGGQKQQELERKSVYAKGKNLIHLNICDPYYDYFRSQMMITSYEIYMWITKYFLKVARDPLRDDLVVANNNVDLLEEIFVSYKYDPCDRLIRDDISGAYILNPNLTTSSTNDSRSNNSSNSSSGTNTTLFKPLALPPEYKDQKKYEFIILDERGYPIKD